MGTPAQTVIINLDTGVFVRDDHNDRTCVPATVITGLETALRDAGIVARGLGGPPPSATATPVPAAVPSTPVRAPASGNSAVVDAFLCIMVEVMARYRDCFIADDAGAVHFSVNKFVATRPSALRRVCRRRGEDESTRLAQSQPAGPARDIDAFVLRPIFVRLRTVARTQLAEGLTQSQMFQVFVADREQAMLGDAEGTPHGVAR